MSNKSVFTIEEFNRMKARLKPHSLSVVGIVCKPHLEIAIRQRLIERSHNPLGFGLSGILVYSDLYQAADVLSFTSNAWLRAYLNRREEPGKWSRLLMRNLFKNDIARARNYGIPWKLPPLTEA